jgi:hypothetical protein
VKRFLLALLAAAAIGNASASNACAEEPASPLRPQFAPGQHFSNIFSLMVSVEGPGFETWVNRVAGSGTYVVSSVTATRVHFNAWYRYDALAAGSSPYTMDLASLYPVQGGKVTPDIQGSGLAYNPFLWGPPRTGLRTGESWDVTIPTQWELGPAGVQHVTVVSVDDAGGMVTLEREGSATSHQPSAKPFPVTVRGAKVMVRSYPDGPTHWRGYTTFRNGIVMSDDVLMEYRVVLKSPGMPDLKGTKRAIMLLNAVPGDT